MHLLKERRYLHHTEARRRSVSDNPGPGAMRRSIDDQWQTIGTTRHAESLIRRATPSCRSETTHPFLIHGGDIEFTSTQGSSYDDACATYPISGAAQESDFSLSLHHLVYSSASSTSRAPTVHLGSNARKRPAKRSRPGSAQLDSSWLRRVDSTPRPYLWKKPDRSNAGTPLAYMKNVLWISRRPIGWSMDSFAQWPRIVNFKRVLFFIALTSLRYLSSLRRLLFCLLSRPAFSPFFFFSVSLFHACLAKPTGHRCSKPLYLTHSRVMAPLTLVPRICRP